MSLATPTLRTHALTDAAGNLAESDELSLRTTPKSKQRIIQRLRSSRSVQGRMLKRASQFVAVLAIVATVIPQLSAPCCCMHQRHAKAAVALHCFMHPSDQSSGPRRFQKTNRCRCRGAVPVLNSKPWIINAQIEISLMSPKQSRLSVVRTTIQRTDQTSGEPPPLTQRCTQSILGVFLIWIFGQFLS